MNTLNAGNSRSCSFVMSSVSVMGISVLGRLKVDIFAEAGGVREDMRWPARR